MPRADTQRCGRLLFLGMDRDWKEQLLRDARLDGMCNENIAALRMCNSKTDAIRLYKKTIDWALEHNYPMLDILRKEFDNDETRDCGMFIDRTFHGELLDKHQVYIFHNCKGRILTALNYDAEIIPMLYFSNGCDMTIDCKQHNVFPIRVPLYIFGDNTITAKSPNAKFVFYKHDTL